MKGIDISCASQAATAICLTIDEGSTYPSPYCSSSIQLGRGRAIDRYKPILRDPKRISKPIIPPCSSSQPPTTKNKTCNAENDERKEKSSSRLPNGNVVISRRKSWSCTRPGDFISPQGSCRYLLSDKALLGVLSDFDPLLKLVPGEDDKAIALKTDESHAKTPPTLSPSQNQVVVLRVSLHCKGCERKVRKHISRMEGVTSFSIDFAAKKVTVSGDLTPLQVLASVSKVKNAQLWTPSMSLSKNA